MIACLQLLIEKIAVADAMNTSNKEPFYIKSGNMTSGKGQKFSNNPFASYPKRQLPPCQLKFLIVGSCL